MGLDLWESYISVVLWRGFVEEIGGREVYGGCCLSLVRR